ncbi:RHS repeat-associated core domain-containing protein [Pseudomonas syringae]|uniref:RHS repeat-associated core domain-containing protein n=1 Tax=Pseudomonas syringae TaxID=317 RepID=UPI001FD1FE6F|nr:RHS repeat-associated core domain-containing protein [Pseudomonas syringae]
MAILCKYTYDPLDRVSTVTPLAQAVANRFYNGEHLMTELHGDRQRTCIRAGAQWLAQQSRDGDEVVTTMIAGDLHNSVLRASKDGHQADIAYTPFGHHQAGQTIAELPGFNGEQPDPLTGHYLLGNGYRAYNPVLMRFNSPDSMSPFGKGGLNAYAYCVGDPVNRVDPTGHFSFVFSGILAVVLGAGGGAAIVASTQIKESDPTLSAVLLGVGIASAVTGAGFAVHSIGKLMVKAGRPARHVRELEDNVMGVLEKKQSIAKALAAAEKNNRLLTRELAKSATELDRLSRLEIKSRRLFSKGYERGYSDGRAFREVESSAFGTPHAVFRAQYKVDRYTGVIPMQGGPRNPLAANNATIRNA